MLKVTKLLLGCVIHCRVCLIVLVSHFYIVLSVMGIFFKSEIYPVIGLHEMSESYRLYFCLFFYNSIKLVF